MKMTDMSQIVNTASPQPGALPQKIFGAAIDAVRKSRGWLSCLPVLMLVVVSPDLPAQDSSRPFMVQGVVLNEAGEPASAAALDFWSEQKKLGSTVSAEDGAFEIELTLDAKAADKLIRVTSEVGHASLSLAQASAGKNELRLMPESEAGGLPVWLQTFFLTILPIVVLAIVVLAIRNRKRANSDA